MFLIYYTIRGCFVNTTFLYGFRSNCIVDYRKPINVGDKTSSDLKNPEGLVVLECINRLLNKGYRPQDLYIEKKWSLGRTSKSGKADICVRHKDSNKNYIIIECKTWGTAYENEKNKMVNNGGQLFSYFQQERDTEFLCLYTSTVENNEIRYENSIVKVENYFKLMGTVEEIVLHWNKQFRQSGIFDNHSSTYYIKLKELIREDLRQLQKEDGRTLFNQFEEILRHNVVSDKGNAFNKLFNLFLCKILDEDRELSERLDFQWIEGVDTNKTFIGRLNTLYKKGMKKYLEKDVTDYEPQSHYNKETNRIIEELRLFKNQEFAFVDVYNENSFNDNALIVKEVVELIQNWQICYTKKQQFLGDFFEKLLNSGFKQESGQFFTPVPLVRFIIKCLPIKEIIWKNITQRKNTILPYIIDFACGSGHFLTESMDIIQTIINGIDTNNTHLTPSQKRDIRSYKEFIYEWAQEYIYGIEKDYRLVKASKLACFMYGDGKARVIHASGLDPFGSLEYTGKLSQKEQFDILIANPPYSIKGFKSTVRKGAEQFTLFDKITDKSKEIEILFIERMADLLVPEGISAIILPEAVLNNTVYFEVRKYILERFLFKGVMYPGSCAFNSGSSTVILFLQKRKNALELHNKQDYAEMVKDQTLIVARAPLDKTENKKFLGYYFDNKRGSEGIYSTENVYRTKGVLFDESNSENAQKINYYFLQNMKNVPIDTINNNVAEFIDLLNLEDCFNWDSKIFENTIISLKKENFTNKKYSVHTLHRLVVEMKDGGTPPRQSTHSQDYFGGDICWCKIEDIAPEITHTKEKLTKLGLENSSAKVWDIDSIIISLGATIGRVGIAKVPTATKQGISGIVVNKNLIRPKYLYYYLLKENERIHKLATGSTFKEVRPKKLLNNLEVLVPPLNVQDAIVLKLDRLRSDSNGNELDSDRINSVINNS